jgi:hypothetical protein
MPDLTARAAEEALARLAPPWDEIFPAEQAIGIPTELGSRALRKVVDFPRLPARPCGNAIR